MFISRFELYKTRNDGELPKRVILYRDGVSEVRVLGWCSPIYLLTSLSAEPVCASTRI